MADPMPQLRPVQPPHRPSEPSPPSPIQCPGCGAQDHFLMDLGDTAHRVLEDPDDTELLLETLGRGPVDLICQRCNHTFAQRGLAALPN